MIKIYCKYNLAMTNAGYIYCGYYKRSTTIKELKKIILQQINTDPSNYQQFTNINFIKDKNNYYDNDEIIDNTTNNDIYLIYDLS
jgi:hypothetical protein